MKMRFSRLSNILQFEEVDVSEGSQQQPDPVLGWQRESVMSVTNLVLLCKTDKNYQNHYNICPNEQKSSMQMICDMLITC